MHWCSCSKPAPSQLPRGSSASCSPGQWIPTPGKLFPPPCACQAHPLCRDTEKGMGLQKCPIALASEKITLVLHWRPCADAGQPMFVHGQQCLSLQSLGTARGAWPHLRGLSREENPTSGVFSLCWLWFLHSVWSLPHLSMTHTQW